MPTLWLHIYTRPPTVQDFELCITRQSLGPFSNYLKTICYIPREGKWEGWYRRAEWQRLMEHLSNEIRSSHWSLINHLEYYDRDSNQLQQAVRRLTREQSLAAYRAYQAAYLPYIDYILRPWGITEHLEQWFIAQLKDKLPDRWQANYEALAKQPQFNEMDKLQLALLRWRLGRGPRTALERLTQRFGYLAVYSINDPVWTADDLRQQAFALERPRQNLKGRQAALWVNRQNIRKAIHELSPWPELQQVAEAINKFVWLRTDRVDRWKRVMAQAKPFYRNLERKQGWPEGWTGHLTIAELESCLMGRPVISSAELARRAKNQYIAYCTKRGTLVISNPKRWPGFLRQHGLEQQLDFNQREMRGNTAYPGQARGRARIILHLKDVPTMQPGEILIANMTHPDYLPAIRKAAGIVTDEGGIVCHAAIISRELKIPCVVGAGEATKAFRTGDLVEVDAEKGIVRKL